MFSVKLSFHRTSNVKHLSILKPNSVICNVGHKHVDGKKKKIDSKYKMCFWFYLLTQTHVYNTTHGYVWICLSIGNLDLIESDSEITKINLTQDN